MWYKMVFLALCLISFGTLPMQMTRIVAVQSEPEENMIANSIINANKNLFIVELNVKEKPAEGAASQLTAVGCGRIVEIKDLDGTDNAYAMTLVDEKGDSYYVTMSYDGYLGFVKDNEGNYLVMPID